MKNIFMDEKGMEGITLLNESITFDQIIQEFDFRDYDLVSEEFVGPQKPLQYTCRKHPNEGIQTTTYYKIHKGMGACHACGREKLASYQRKTHEQCQEKVWVKNPHIMLVTQNPEAYDDVECYCTKHKQYFIKNIRTLYRCHSGCKECYTMNVRKNCGMGQKEFNKRLHKIHPTVECLEPYQNNEIKLQFYCSKHDCTFSCTPAGILGKITCCPKTFATSKEQQIGMILEKWDYRIERQKVFPGCQDKHPLAFDYYLTDFNIAIEYDGENHFRPVGFGTQSYEEAVAKHEYTMKHDNIKNKYCKEHHIKLLRIPYWEFEDAEYFLFDNLVKLGAIEEITAS